ncbi:hypothetical protein [Pannonibacter sp. SL95]|uniref:hypothetical protein n=1 Tax=Pannonibacter sp. SL95 TaxID=2995153 RepID=UPI002275E364|nr:hypothetical protein [Pannonibacter sp. SL95]MCY1709015.1 hypothetical protein [Pannonibacter sp. SL95]
MTILSTDHRDAMKREKGIVLDKDRHGNLRCYYRRAGLPKIRLREPYGSDAFYDELACARLGQPYVKADTRPKPMAETAAQGHLRLAGARIPAPQQVFAGKKHAGTKAPRPRRHRR